MNGYAIAQLIGFAIAVGILIALIVVLTQFPLVHEPAAPTKNEININTKVTWLFIIEIVSAGLMVLLGLLTFFFYRGWSA